MIKAIKAIKIFDTTPEGLTQVPEHYLNNKIVIEMSHAPRFEG
jgi:hypothetical protein